MLASLMVSAGPSCRHALTIVICKRIKGRRGSARLLLDAEMNTCNNNEANVCDAQCSRQKCLVQIDDGSNHRHMMGLRGRIRLG